MMKRVLTLGVFACIIASGVFLSGCGKKAGVKDIKEWARYQDPYYKIGFTYPKGWEISADGGKVSVYSSALAAQKFFDPTVKGEDGVQLIVAQEKMEKIQTLDELVSTYQSELSTDGYKVEPVQSKKIDGSDAKLVSFSGLRATDAKIHTSRIIMVKDSMMVYAQYSAFNDVFEPYKTVLDTLLASLTLPKPKSAAEIANPALPSSEYDAFDNFAVKVLYPNNFEPSTPRPKGDIQFALDIKGYRQDCSVHLDIRPAQKLSVEKVFEQNVKFYQALSKGETKVDGLKALYVNFKPMKGIDGRAYFVVKNDKMVRIILSIYEPMKADFLPVFEKIVSSIKIK
jgi:hypothetical protein